jgi:hypothetical protein
MEASLKIIILGSILFNGVSINYYGLNFNLERVVLVVLFVPILMTILFSGTSAKRSGTFKGGWLVGLWCFTLLISLTLTNDPAAHLNGYAISVAPAIMYFLFATGRTNPVVLQNTTELILWYLSAVGVAMYVLWISDPPGWVADYIDRNRIRLTLYEANIFGATVSYFLIIHFPQFRRIARHYALYSLALFAIFLSFSRTPYIGFASGVIIYLFLTGFFRSWRYIFMFVIVCVLGGVVSILYSNDLINIYVANLYRADSYSSRMIGLEFAYQRFLAHPLFGNGPLDFGLYNQEILFVLGSQSIHDVWIWQIFMAVAHDSGVIGLIVYLAFLVGLIWHGYRLAVVNLSKQHAAYLAGFIALLIDCQTTTLHLTALFGVAAGLLGSGIQIPMQQVIARPAVQSIRRRSLQRNA